MTLLEVTPSWQNIMLTGRHGIGKSQILTKYFETQGLPVKTLFLGQMSDEKEQRSIAFIKAMKNGEIEVKVTNNNEKP